MNFKHLAQMLVSHIWNKHPAEIGSIIEIQLERMYNKGRSDGTKDDWYKDQDNDAEWIEDNGGGN